MKKIALIFRNRDNMEAIGSMEEIMINVFEDFVKIEKFYVNEFTANTKIEADVYVVIDKRLIFKLRNHAAKFNNVVQLSRNCGKDQLSNILNIPEGSDVLVVNDTFESGEEMCYMFYELGICHVNFIPFDPQKPNDRKYDHIQYAITPNEPQMVPARIKNVINTGYRKIGFDTIVQIINMLNLNNERINYNLLKYAGTIIEPMQVFQISYFNSFLKSQMLNEYVYDSQSAIFLCDNEGRIIYYNKHAKEIFDFTDESKAKIEEYIPENMNKRITSDQEIIRELINVYGVNYIMNKLEIVVAGQNMGYFITMQDEIAIKDIETSFSKRLREKGLLARYTFDDIIYRSAAMAQCINLTKRAALSEYTILIRGESGTGKELLAQSIHNYSPRRSMPFVGVNCAAIPESLLESELFGYEEGAFTGARKRGKLGYFEHADKGTIFLDEIGDISPKLQARLLRVLQEKQIMRIGSDKVIDIDVRIIAATNKNLLEEVRTGRFREDLYYRLNAIKIKVPPLRERKEDVDLLFKEFMGKDYISVKEDEHRKLREYSWPGNVRELENCALYYKTLKSLPELMEEEKDFSGDHNSMKDKIKAETLEMIYRHSQLCHGIGRTALLQLLTARGYDISDSFLRTLLLDLEKEKCITIGRGRQGTVITDKGREMISGI